MSLVPPVTGGTVLGYSTEYYNKTVGVQVPFVTYSYFIHLHAVDRGCVTHEVLASIFILVVASPFKKKDRST